jgi:hypothetical protein
MNNTIKGILTDCFSGETKEIELEYKIRKNNIGERVFYLLNGVTGYESFSIDNSDYIKSIGLGFNKEQMIQRGWLACMGTPRKYDKLYIPGSEMEKALAGI